VTRVADRRGVRGVIIIAAVAATVALGALGLTAGMVAIMVAYALASAAYMPVMMLADTYALRGLAQRRLAYGPVRMWGSVAFIFASFGAGALLDVMAARDLIWLIVAAMAVATLAATALVPLDIDIVNPAASPARATPVWRDPSFLAVIAAASLVQSSHAVYYGFSTIDWQAVGFGGQTIGGLWALGVIVEIAIFAMSARLPPALPPSALLLIGAAGALLRWSAMAIGPPPAALPALQALHGLSFGATHLGALGFVVRAAPPGAGAKAQGYLAVVLGLTTAAAMAAAGALYDRYGGHASAPMAGRAVPGGMCAFFAWRRTTDPRQ